MKKKYYITGTPTSQHTRYPFPDSDFFPNRKKQHRYLKGKRDHAKEAGFYITKDAGLILPEKPLRMSFIICPPDLRWRDDDNIFKAFKHYRDGIFLALGIDDRLVRRSVIEWGKPEFGSGAIFIRFEVMEPIEYTVYTKKV